MQFPWKKKVTEAMRLEATENPKLMPAQSDELDLLNDEIAMRQAQVTQLEEQVREAANQLAEIGHLSAQLKVQLSEGASNATTSLDALEREELSIRRVRDGLTLRIQSLQQEIAPKVAMASEMAAARDVIRQDAAVAELTSKADAMTAELLASWRTACATGFELMTMLDSAIAGRVSLDAEHKRQVSMLITSVRKKLFHASLEQVNERWRFVRPDAFHQLKVLPGKPRSEVTRVG